MNALASSGENERCSASASEASLPSAAAVRSAERSGVEQIMISEMAPILLANTDVCRSFRAVTTRNWLGGSGLPARKSARPSRAFFTSSAILPPRPPPGRKVTPFHHVSLTGSRNGGVLTDDMHSLIEASCDSAFEASPDTISTALSRHSCGTCSAIAFFAASSASYSSSPTASRMFFVSFAICVPYYTTKSHAACMMWLSV